MSERFREDPALAGVLAAFAVPSSALLGSGGEASVFALDQERVLRIYRPGPTRATLERRANLLAELATLAPESTFAIPRVLELDIVHERWVTIEPRYPGLSLAEALQNASGSRRTALLHAYLEAGRQLAMIALPRSFYGDLLADDAIRSDRFRGFLEARARRSLDAAGPTLAVVDPAELAHVLPEPAQRSFVYLDNHPTNVLVEGERVTAIIDFGGTAIIGDPRFGAVVPATYLPDSDQAAVEAWLSSQQLAELRVPVQRWLAAFWSFARDDVPLFEWCQRVLLNRG